MKNKLPLLFLFIISLFPSCLFNSVIEELTEPDDAKVTRTDFNKSGTHFEDNVLNVYVGDTVYLPLIIEPEEVQSKVTIGWEYDENYISITPDNFGVIIEGKNPGPTWIKASCNGIVATCLISVLAMGDEIYDYQYIFSNDSVCEIKTNTSYTVTASLYGGSIAEMEMFEWQILDDNIATISASRNNCVITARKPGSTQLVCKHPNAEYEYTFVVFCYTDLLTVPYMTTSSNVLTLDKNTVTSTTVSVELKNPYSANFLDGFHWDYADSQSSSVIRIAGNRSDCNIVPLANGIAKIKVTHDMCEYPLYIYVRVTTIVKNVYIDVSSTTLVVDGSDKPFSITASIKNYDGYANNEEFQWTVKDPDLASLVMEHSSVGNTFTVYGKKNGKITVTVSHPLSEYSRSIVVILQNQAGSAVDSSMYITTTQNYVQTKVGDEPTTISIRLIGGKDGVDNIGAEDTNFTWWIADGTSNGVIEVQNVTGVVKNLNSRSAVSSGESTPATIVIRPLKEGEAKIVVTHPRCRYDTAITVKVYGKDVLINPVVLTTDDSVIKLLNGHEVNVTATLRNAAAGAENNITWASANTSVITAEPAQGQTTVLRAVGSGSHQTYVTAHLDEALSDKKILVLSADTTQALETMKGIYADSTYLRIAAGETKDINVSSFGLTTSDRISWSTVNSSLLIVNGVASSEHCSYASVTGLSEGTATITASLSGCEPVTFNVTVLPEGSSSEILDENAGYLTTALNAVVVQNTDEYASLSVSGVNISQEDMNLHTKWTMFDESAGDGNIFDIYGTGPEVQIKANRPGKTKIKVENKFAQNSLDIYAKCGELYEWVDDPIIYITTENDVVNIKNGQTTTIACTLANSTQTGTFYWSLKEGFDIIDIVGLSSGTCNISTKAAGQAIISCTNTLAPDIAKEILVNVANSESELNGFTYLTSVNNVVNVSQGGNITVAVDIVNATGPVISGYSWQIDSAGLASDICAVADSGNIAVVYGKNIGTTKITVTNNICDFPLEIIVNVVDPIAAAQNPYISCQSIVTATIGKGNVKLVADLVGGSASDYTNFSWSVADDTIATVYGSNETAEIKPLREGVTIVNISHPKANVSRKVLVICEAAVVTDCYITTTESIIKMSPSDSERTITATLVNGDGNDVYDFKWWADSYDIINMNYTNEYCVIQPLKTGVVTIHVSHPKAPNPKDIVLYISQYTDFAFSQKSVTVNTGGDDVFVTMEVPATTTACEVSYESSDNNVCTVYGNSTACIVHPGNAGSCTVTAKLQTKGGVVQATAQMLVVNQYKDVTAPYLSVDGSTIRNIAVNETVVLKGAITGNGVFAGDENGITWTITNPNIVSFVNVAGNTTKAAGISVKGINAGSTTIVLSHNKASSVTMYVTVTGTSDPRISLNYSENSIYIDESPFKLVATVENDQGSEIVWNNTDDTVINMNAKNKQASITPLKVGKATVSCYFKDNPSSVQYCTITVLEPEVLKMFTWVEGEDIRITKQGVNLLTMYPGDSRVIHYYTIPEKVELDETATYVSDSNYFDVKNLGYVSSFYWNGATHTADDNYGTMIISSRAVVTRNPIGFSFKAKNGMSATFTATSDYNYYFTINKNSISEYPMNVCDGGIHKELAVDYQIRPDVSKVQIHAKAGSGLRVQNADYSETIGGTTIYTISRHNVSDPTTGIAKGTIQFVADNEVLEEVRIVGFNDQVVTSNNIAGQSKQFGPQPVNFDIAYKEHTFNVWSASSGHSKYDSSSNCIFITDGETAKITVTPKEPYSSFQASASFRSSGQGTSSPNNKKKNSDCIAVSGTPATVSQNKGLEFTISHNFDFNFTNGFWNNVPSPQEKEIEKNNDTARVIEFVGNVEIKCSLSTNREYIYKIPVYCEVRNSYAR